MTTNELITMPDDMKAVVKVHQEVSQDVEFDPSNPNYYIPHFTGALGKSALRNEVAVKSPDLIDDVPGRPRTQSAQFETPTQINPAVDRRKVPGTDEFEDERIRISTIARSEWALSGGVSKEDDEK
jgi:hypothetical protein